MQMLNRALPIKLDKDDYMLWRTQMENMIYANDFEDHSEGLTVIMLAVIQKQQAMVKRIQNLFFGEDLTEWSSVGFTPHLLQKLWDK